MTFPQEFLQKFNNASYFYVLSGRNSKNKNLEKYFKQSADISERIPGDIQFQILVGISAGSCKNFSRNSGEKFLQDF